MSKHFSRDIISGQAAIVEAPAKADLAAARSCNDRSFQIPTGLYATMAGLYFGFIGIMALGFQSPGMVIPVAIIGIFLAMIFGVPSIWTRLSPQPATKPLGWYAFMGKGMDTCTGRLSAKDVSIQMLILPVLVVGWGLTMVTIAAVVR